MNEDPDGEEGVMNWRMNYQVEEEKQMDKERQERRAAQGLPSKSRNHKRQNGSEDDDASGSD